MSEIRKDANEISMDMLECCSLLVDGECSEQELDEFLTQYSGDHRLGSCVQEYHLIGDVLRSAEFAQSHILLSKSFDRVSFRERLSKEPLLLAPVEATRHEPKRRKLQIRWSQWTGLAVASIAVISLVGVLYTSEENVLADMTRDVPATAAIEKVSESQVLPREASRESNVTLMALANHDTPVNVNRRKPQAYYMAAHQQFGYDAMLNRGYAMQTAAHQ